MKKYVRIVDQVVTNVIELDHPPTFDEPETSLWIEVPEGVEVETFWLVAPGGAGGYVPPNAPQPVDLVAYTANRRWQAEQVGTIWNGWPIHTDDRSQGKYLSELQAISLGVRQENLGWKFADGVFRPVSNADFPQLAIAARAHVLTVFGIEEAVLAQIEIGAITTSAEIETAFANAA